MPTISIYDTILYVCLCYKDARRTTAYYIEILKSILKLHTKSEFTQVKLHSQKTKKPKKKKLSLGVLCNKLYKLNYFNYEIPKSLRDSKKKE